jgi:7-keto-8-aminopelargonate synthetase-like enzyme
LDLRDPFIEYLNEHATTFIHSSQPATPVLNAALVSLDVHDRHGELQRRALHAAVERFGAGLVSIGQAPHAETSSPIQSVMIASVALALDLATALRNNGILDDSAPRASRESLWRGTAVSDIRGSLAVRDRLGGGQVE